MQGSVIQSVVRRTAPDEARMASAVEAAGRGERGFSLIEALIGAALLLIVVVGVLPLYARSMIDNTAGADYTRVTTFASSAAEQLYQAGFNDPTMTLTGASTSLTTPEYYSETTKRWLPLSGSAPAGTHWLRTTTVRQYDEPDGVDDGIFNMPLPGNTFPTAVHVKEVQVQVISASAAIGALGGRRQMDMRYLKFN